MVQAYPNFAKTKFGGQGELSTKGWEQEAEELTGKVAQESSS
jgi:hypothetical protein